MSRQRAESASAHKYASGSLLESSCLLGQFHLKTYCALACFCVGLHVAEKVDHVKINLLRCACAHIPVEQKSTVLQSSRMCLACAYVRVCIHGGIAFSRIQNGWSVRFHHPPGATSLGLSKASTKFIYSVAGETPCCPRAVVTGPVSK